MKLKLLLLIGILGVSSGCLARKNAERHRCSFTATLAGDGQASDRQLKWFETRTKIWGGWRVKVETNPGYKFSGGCSVRACQYRMKAHDGSFKLTFSSAYLQDKSGLKTTMNYKGLWFGMIRENFKKQKGRGTWSGKGECTRVH